MTSLEDLIKLCGQDSGKVFVVDSAGDVQLVIMGVGEYQKMLVTKVAEQLADIEKINQEITQAQLVEAPEPPVAPRELFKSVAFEESSVQANGLTRQDLRSEVIDPTFNFDAPDMYSAEQASQD
jgi:hypothetical protein